jgi:hypothetical protein
VGFGERREFVMGRKRVKSGHGSESELKPKVQEWQWRQFWLELWLFLLLKVISFFFLS